MTLDEYKSPHESAGEIKKREYIERILKGSLEVSDITPERLGSFYPAVVDYFIEQIPEKNRGEHWEPALVKDMWVQARPVDSEDVDAQSMMRKIALHCYDLKWNENQQGSIPPEIIPVEDYESVKDSTGMLPEIEVNNGLEAIYDAPTAEEKVEKLFTEKSPTKLDELVEELSVDLKETTKAYFKKLLSERNNPKSREALTQGVIQFSYDKLRIADYPFDPDEQSIWDEAATANPDNKITVKEQNGWMYRGNLEGQSVTRGSFNVRVTPELIGKLDDLIAQGVVNGNYKFGQPDTPGSYTNRHDAITIYFHEQPSEEVLKQLTDTIKPFVRGDKLLGKKVAEGFYMTEISSVKEEHVVTLVETLETIDPGFAAAVKFHCRRPDSKSLAMSEAQYYAIQKTADAFGYGLSYTNTGFEVSLVSDEIASVSIPESNEPINLAEEQPAVTDIEMSGVPLEAEHPINPVLVEVSQINELSEGVQRESLKMESLSTGRELNVPNQERPEFFSENNKINAKNLAKSLDVVSGLILSRNRLNYTKFLEGGELTLLHDGISGLNRGFEENDPLLVRRAIDSIYLGVKSIGTRGENSTNDKTKSIDEVGYALEAVKKDLKKLDSVYAGISTKEAHDLANVLNMTAQVIIQKQDYLFRLRTALDNLHRGY